MKKIPTTPDEWRDSVAALRNESHWSKWIDRLESAVIVNNEPEKPLTDAVNYVSWLLMSAENLAYRLRWHFFAEGDFKKRKLFNADYRKLLKRCEAAMPDDVCRCATFAVRLRHLIVHKGFPDPQGEPMRWRGEGDFYWRVRDEAIEPANFEIIRSRFRSVHDWLDASRTALDFNLGELGA